eukprot:CAMPEP_0176503466 /NCGR_PEP_ID=MMETSP0200_2-20121128/15377_1 /TAXON_ID=947934 /ORGANISM="Chaetoceros sp., Strain GSL56" /LENGTH=333 /DNA_ID=CAMNT_0017902757 /DNA_START=36 /DNA_END=1037 /DNA_ORIENTATION=-
MVAKFKEVDAYGNVYKGDVLNGRRHGQGILLYAQTGDVYQGDFENGLPHGSGKYIRGGKVEGNKDGIFEGLWENGQLIAVKKGKEIQKPPLRSRSRGDRMTPIYSGQEQRDDSHQIRQNGAQHTHNANFPPRSPSRMSSHRQEKHQNKMIDGIPMMISFPSFSDHQDGDDEDALKFDDDTGFVGVEYQVPSHTRVKKDDTLNAFPRNRSSFSRNNHKNATHGGNTSSKSRKQVSHQQLQQRIIVDNASSNSQKDFGFLRPFSRKRSKAKEKPTDTNNPADVFVNEYYAQQTHSVPFVEMYDTDKPFDVVFLVHCGSADLPRLTDKRRCTFSWL